MRLRTPVAMAAAVILCLGAAAAVHGYREYQRQQAVRFEQALPIDLHITSVSTQRTYTVRAKFYVRGRQYVSPPLKVRFARVEPTYHLMLYYNKKNPMVSSWKHFSTNTVHLSILIAMPMSMRGRGLAWRGRRGKLLILRFTPRGLRRLRLETTRS